ncbi:hypothetical protein PENSUB_4091 [Penicillium subrubescens]|uniref:Uncharacterized protein n=1 Tax=Penicillium subrubescens TaxID=1316194 RepID=A0A1Q5UDB7_9EURO|nr:hypothetical protein PENSUB_4091 [Penicillium subrubescens]
MSVKGNVLKYIPFYGSTRCFVWNNGPFHYHPRTGKDCYLETVLRTFRYCTLVQGVYFIATGRYERLSFVRATIFLGKDQVQLTVEPYILHRAIQGITNLTQPRLLSSGLLFSTEGNRT